MSLTKCWMTLPQAALLSPHLGVHHHARELPVGVVHGRSRRPPRKPRPPPPDRRRSRARPPGGRRRSCERAHLPRAEARGPPGELYGFGRVPRRWTRQDGTVEANPSRNRPSSLSTSAARSASLRRGSASSVRPVITRATACSTNSRQQRNGAKGFLRATKGSVRRYAVRGGSGAVDNRSRVGGIQKKGSPELVTQP